MKRKDLGKKASTFILIALLLTTAFSTVTADSKGIADSPWPMFRGGPRHTGRSPYDTSHVDGTVKWNFSTGSSVRSSPAVGSDGTIYVGSGDGNLYAINPDGTEKWNFSTGRNIRSSPAVGSRGIVYVGSNDGNLYAINPDGSQRWNFSTTSQVWSSPAIGSEKIYVGLNNTIAAFDFSMDWKGLVIPVSVIAILAAVVVWTKRRESSYENDERSG